MTYGKEEYFSKEHFEKHKGYAPAYLCELVVYCMELLSSLSAMDLKFRFKGGNSLLLILDRPERFSIDIDIATADSKETVIQAMKAVEKASPHFTKLEIRQHKTKPWLPMISFKLYFDSIYQKPGDAYVMLDAVLKEAPYEGYVTEIKSGDIYESDRSVEVSTPAGLIGDKLLTIGPSTLGIPIGKGKDAQRLKHVFDISRLWKLNPDVGKISESVNRCMKQEMEIQQNVYTLPEVIEDTVKFCKAPQKYAAPPNPETVKNDLYLYEITTGFEGFRKHLIHLDYTWEMLKSDLRTVSEIIKSL